MWFNKRRIEPYSTPVSYCNIGSAEFSQSEFIEESPVNEFMFQEVEHDGVKSITLTSDIFMLFNQQRLDKMSRERLVQYFNDLSVRDTQMSELRSKLTDDQLCSFVKSRYIQSRSELMAWSHYLMASQDSVIADIAAQQAEQQPVEQPVEQPSDPAPSPTE